MNIPQLKKHELTFPNPNDANEDGIVAWGGDLNPPRLIRAYQNGIFPWYAKNDPIIWWSTDPRLIMELGDFKLSRSLKKSMKKFHYKIDANFIEVMKQCSSVKRENQNGTWIQDEIIEAYSALHDMDMAHSIESYQNGKLVGGLYGVVVGKVFCGESMFSLVNDASKSAYAILIKHLKFWGYDFIDSQVPTEHLKSLGAKEVTREYFLSRLYKVNMDIIKHKWQIENSIID
ncbi:MAG: leucyl/phenylalanyl-tRNA--protein transferase [Sulfurimonas sp.]|uniref:leucyl/phenylalanyl-tRNA--protein transferase n=1 Tax=unclassified Sulfurimonas TaxID=2623549 RepID=UPI0008B624BC|nr:MULTISPECIES: leucyl/phenylalanyl-tRNA--protein transferase [unclassified Sulfurimonas]MBS4067903.1 leucyl/phenylalanyl-tRNA--protein transferase [Sulfurimonas sp.]MDD3856337.1 leucyl/phenylalanyl-tRNA--protein transferase [Sulfurimonas sp.]OHE04349.1 MAG: leucyl/phenylalanyl-tRNA--protein transferase [Sulfurimonas sp. RIFOXYB12_FULL_35_9]OHE11099.1 MAG: leucyl/phenylalanyl-tRNA--protein transferase [Sulfurimonas sp. RIFOXYC2_FULL_36_7]